MRKRWEIEWGLKYPSTCKMIERMKSKRNPKSINTIALYCNAVLTYTKHYLKTETPEQALKQTKTETIDKFIDFLMESKGYTPKSVRVLFYGVKYWLETNNVKIAEVQLPKSTIIKTFDRAPNRSELEKLLTFTDIRGKALIEIAVSSGLRLDTILSLKWKDISFNENTIINVQPLEGRKTSKPFFTFLTPEATKIVREYQNWLIREGFPMSPESYIIVNVNMPNRKISSNAMTMWWNRLLKQAGLTEKTHKYYVLHFHTLRKYFKTACTNADVKREYIEFWMGHRGAYLDDSYFRASLEDHIHEYQKAIPYLSITEAQKQLTELDIAKKTALMSLRSALSPEAYRMIEPLILNAKSTEQINETIDKARTERLKPNQDCTKVVNENQLEEWLAKGYKFIAVLPSGKILISNE
jgi:integrase